MVEDKVAQLLDKSPDFILTGPGTNVGIGIGDNRENNTIYIQESPSAQQGQFTNGQGYKGYVETNVQLIITGSNNYFTSKEWAEKLFDHINQNLTDTSLGILQIQNQTPTLLSRSSGNINEFSMEITITYERN